jgi:hypothetical protein
MKMKYPWKPSCRNQLSKEATKNNFCLIWSSISMGQPNDHSFWWSQARSSISSRRWLLWRTITKGCRNWRKRWDITWALLKTWRGEPNFTILIQAPSSSWLSTQKTTPIIRSMEMYFCEGPVRKSGILVYSHLVSFPTNQSLKINLIFLSKLPSQILLRLNAEPSLGSAPSYHKEYCHLLIDSTMPREGPVL